MLNIIKENHRIYYILTLRNLKKLQLKKIYLINSILQVEFNWIKPYTKILYKSHVLK